MSEHILVPLDGSPLAELALQEALRLASPSGASVTLLHVVAPIEDVISSDGDVFTVDQQWENRRIHALEYLKSIASRPEWRNVKLDIAVEMGNPAEVIVDFARKHFIDHVVMSRRGRSGLSRWVLGGVADKVLRASDRTVVLVRAEADTNRKGSGSTRELAEEIKAR